MAHNIRLAPTGSTLAATQALLDTIIATGDPWYLVLAGEYTWNGSLNLNGGTDVGIIGANCHITQQNAAVATIVATTVTRGLITDIHVTGGTYAVSCLGGTGEVRHVTLDGSTTDAVEEHAGWSWWSYELSQLAGDPDDIGAEDASNKGVANGYAALDADGNIDPSQLTMAVDLWDSTL
jgi:hypothetical protein